MARKKAQTAAMPMPDESWRARDDLRTLSSAHEISQDSKRFRAAQAEAKRQMMALHRVAGAPARKRKSRRERLADVEL